MLIETSLSFENPPETTITSSIKPKTSVADKRHGVEIARCVLRVAVHEAEPPSKHILVSFPYTDAVKSNDFDGFTLE